MDSCESLPTTDGPAREDLAVSNLGSDLTVMRAVWLGSACDQPYEFLFHKTAADFALDGTLGPGAVCFAIYAQIPFEIRLHLREPVDAATVTATMTYLHASPLP